MLTAVYPPRGDSCGTQAFLVGAGGVQRDCWRLQSRCTCDNLRREWRSFRVALVCSKYHRLFRW